MRKRFQRLRARGREAGEGVSLVIILPVIILILGLFLFAGRVAIAGNAVTSAANAAARDASLAREPGTARQNARQAAQRIMTQQDIACSSLSVDVDTAGLHAAVGQPATVSATVTCVANLSDIAIPGIPGSRTMSASGTSPVDMYRQR
jgi:Flp pilus assembly protein TadG